MPLTLIIGNKNYSSWSLRAWLAMKLECLARSGGPFLYGAFSIADAFFAPVVTRFVTYGVTLPPALGNYSERVLELPALREWIAAAQAEPEVIRT
jgi:glutathione S-transferase